MKGSAVFGEAGIVEPKMPTTVDEVKSMSWSELCHVFALTYAAEVRAVLDYGDDALRSEVERWEPEARAAVARALAVVG